MASQLIPADQLPPEFWDFASIRWSTCTLGYALSEEPLFVPAYRIETSTTTYGAPGAQVSTVTKEVRGPAVEANGQYYADKFAYCRATWATQCNPNGSCPYEGLNEIILGRSITTNYYGKANELVRTIVDTWAPTLTIAQPSDWRSGVVRGIPYGFDQNLSQTDLYRASRTDTTYYKQGNANIQKTITYNSGASRGVGLGGDLDALNGIKTTQIRTSTTNTTVDVAPDRVNTPTTSTEEKQSTLVLSTGRYQTPPPETGPYEVDMEVPVPLLLDTEQEIDDALEAYENYIVRMVKGESYGLQVSEELRTDVATGWYPGMPFRYHDPSKGKTFAMRMDATTWGVTRDESGFATDGLWIGDSNGTVTIPENLVGNSRPDMGSGSLPPTAVVPPSVDGETNVDSGSFVWKVNVHMGMNSSAKVYGRDGVVPIMVTDLSYPVHFTTTCWVDGIIVGPGDVLATNPDGSIPLDANGSLVVADATSVDPDLFA